MVLVANPAPRTATPLRRPVSGLLASPAARVRDRSADENFAGGMEWQVELQQPTSEFLLAMAAGCAVAMPPEGADDKAPLERAFPFTIAAGDWCTTFGWQQHDYVGRAQRNLDAARSFLIAQEVWYGAVAQAQTLDNPWLAKTGTPLVTAAALAPQKALARLDREGMTQLYNQQFAIHIDTEGLDRLQSAQAIYRDGQNWVTANGTFVVADGGYRNGALDGQTAGKRWMVAVPIMDVVLDGPERRGSNAPDSWVAAGMFNQPINNVVYWVQQDVIVYTENVLLQVAAQWDDT